jgi:hypothetical protein
VIDEQTVDELICEAEKEMTGGLEEWIKVCQSSAAFPVICRLIIVQSTLHIILATKNYNVAIL